MTYSPAQFRKNLLIGGNFTTNPWQRGVSAVTATNTYRADRWHSRFTLPVGTANYLQTADGPPGYRRCLEVFHSGTNEPSPGDYCIRQVFEVQHVKQFIGKPLTASFWYKSNKTGLHSVSFGTHTGTFHFGSETITKTFNVNVANVWEFKEVYLGIPTITTYGVNAEDQFGAWLELGFKSNSLGQSSINISDFFRIAHVQLEIGTVFSGFEYRTAAEDLLLCQRYYEKSHDKDNYPGEAATTYGVYHTYSNTAPTSNYAGGAVTFKVPKRAGPSISLYDLAGASGKVTRWNGSTATNGIAASIANVKTTGFRWSCAVTNTGDYETITNYAAEAEI
jgi:hypothetical protein